MRWDDGPGMTALPQAFIYMAQGVDIGAMVWDCLYIGCFLWWDGRDMLQWLYFAFLRGILRVS